MFLVAFPANAQGLPDAAVLKNRGITLFVASTGEGEDPPAAARQFRSFVTRVNRLGTGVVQIKYLGDADALGRARPMAAGPGDKVPSPGSTGKGLKSKIYDFLFLPQGIYLGDRSDRGLRAAPGGSIISDIRATAEQHEAALLNQEREAARIRRSAGQSLFSRAWYGNQQNQSNLNANRRARPARDDGGLVRWLKRGGEFSAETATAVGRVAPFAYVLDMLGGGWKIASGLAGDLTNVLLASPLGRPIGAKLGGWRNKLGAFAKSVRRSIANRRKNPSRVVIALKGFDRPAQRLNLALIGRSVIKGRNYLTAGTGVFRQGGFFQSSLDLIAPSAGRDRATDIPLAGQPHKMTNTLVINMSRWNTLPDEARQIITRAMLDHDFGSISTKAGGTKKVSWAGNDRHNVLAGFLGGEYVRIGFSMWRRLKSGEEVELPLAGIKRLKL